MKSEILDQNKHEAIYMTWKECVPAEFYKFICKQENFSYLNGKNVIHPRIADIVWRFICEDENNYKKPRENLRKYKNFFQYVFSSVYTDVYCNSERRSFDIKSKFQINFKEYKDKKSEQFGKDLNAYKNREDISSFEQKPISVDDFPKEEEERLAEKMERKKRKRQKEKLQPLKKIRKNNQKCLLLY